MQIDTMPSCCDCFFNDLWLAILVVPCVLVRSLVTSRLSAAEEEAREGLDGVVGVPVLVAEVAGVEAGATVVLALVAEIVVLVLAVVVTMSADNAFLVTAPRCNMLLLFSTWKWAGKGKAIWIIISASPTSSLSPAGRHAL